MITKLQAVTALNLATLPDEHRIEGSFSSTVTTSNVSSLSIGYNLRVFNLIGHLRDVLTVEMGYTTGSY
jgi:hypothetical protein